MILNRDGKHYSLSISLQDNTVLSDTSIKLLGVVLDERLEFDGQVSVMYLKASRQIDALKRVSKCLDEKCLSWLMNNLYRLIVQFHDGFRSSGEQPEQRNSAHTL